MSAMMMRRGRVMGMAAAAAIALSMVPVGGAQAVSECTVTGYSPTKLVLGSVNKKVTFAPKVTGCTVVDWAVLAEALPGLIAEKSAPTVTVVPRKLTNEDAGKKEAIVIAIGANDGRGQYAELDTTFQLLRGSSFGTSLNATPEPVKKGAKITIKGTLSRANWNKAKTLKYIGFPKAKIQLQFKADGTTKYVVVKGLTAGTGGKISTTVTATKSGRWRLAFAGISTTASSVSASDAVKVVD